MERTSLRMNFVMNELFYRFIINERNFILKNIKFYTERRVLQK